jgi:hypothetical protein
VQKDFTGQLSCRTVAASHSPRVALAGGVEKGNPGKHPVAVGSDREREPKRDDALIRLIGGTSRAAVVNGGRSSAGEVVFYLMS